MHDTLGLVQPKCPLPMDAPESLCIINPPKFAQLIDAQFLLFLLPNKKKFVELENAYVRTILYKL